MLDCVGQVEIHFGTYVTVLLLVLLARATAETDLLAIYFVPKSGKFVVTEGRVHFQEVYMQAPVAFAYAPYRFLVVYFVELPHFKDLVALALDEGRGVPFDAFGAVKARDDPFVRAQARYVREVLKMYDSGAT